MGRSFRIGSVRGVPIRLHWSFPLLGVLVILPSSGRTTARSLAEGLIWIAALFVCIVVHELSHSFVARRRGFLVHDIVLLPIGGVSEISGLPGAPRDELAIAIAGPLGSLALALLFAVAGLVSGAVLWPPSMFAGAILSRLLWANLLLAGFNLLPAIPMDGGRVLRALLAHRRTDLRATGLAVQIGRFIGLAMVVVGLRYDLWLSFVGVFVFVGAAGEKRAAALRTAVGGLSVGDVMVPDPTTLEASFPLAAVSPFLTSLTGTGPACGRPRTVRRPDRGRPAPGTSRSALSGRRHRSRRGAPRARRPLVPGRGGVSQCLPASCGRRRRRRPRRRCPVHAPPRSGAAPGDPRTGHLRHPTLNEPGTARAEAVFLIKEQRGRAVNGPDDRGHAQGRRAARR